MLFSWRYLLLFCAISIGAVPAAFAQEPTLQNLRIQIEQLAAQVAGISAESNKLLRANKQLTDRIRTAKQDLQQGSDRLLERQLQDDLQASRELSDQIQALDDRIYALTEESVAKQRLLVGMLNDEIERLAGEARAAKDAKTKTRIPCRGAKTSGRSRNLPRANGQRVQRVAVVVGCRPGANRRPR